MNSGHVPTDIISEALRITGEAERRKITMRLMGACAIRVHCPRFAHLLNSMKRELTDMDFMAYNKNRMQMEQFLIGLGYTPDKKFIALLGGRRHIYYSNDGNYKVDVFFDRLEMCHIVEFRRRLELDYPTITLADLLLEKMQIVQINEKDIKDTIVLLREHDIGNTENEIINAKYIAELLANDWGFCYTVTMNLKKEKALLSEYKVLTEGDRKDIEEKIDGLLEYIEKEPKSIKWRIRSRVGLRKKWYRDVESIVR